MMNHYRAMIALEDKTAEKKNLWFTNFDRSLQLKCKTTFWLLEIVNKKRRSLPPLPCREFPPMEVEGTSYFPEKISR